MTTERIDQLESELASLKSQIEALGNAQAAVDLAQSFLEIKRELACLNESGVA